MGSTETVSFEQYLAGLPMDAPDCNLIKDILDSQYGFDGETIAFRSVIPALIDSDLLIATACRWRSVQSHFGKPVRVYALSPNPKTEKYVQSLLSVGCDVYLTPVPVQFKEHFK